ncbi:MAG: MBL fold metallo-hydrolase [Thaumarchaeota archaeon]|nr:MBL fold metallo-hydrolase [Candidatus Terraquivivens yellowstonensis]MCL7392982.1 MBL fold metallo-hydrolase [Candidatus Terraquivivens yellowstonensis]MCL7395397.1 MBL fold metallo-hydrolase [Candidatus Terraquivivens yellowstonensis]MCL7398003.1 MBL fold metallo-hydrolase [Candidatus Terraquivivens yellowstonensis]MCL7398795.1 MBL fold metallo-hydrolase [Candidatus Terraquivivens yellowstonensis]
MPIEFGGIKISWLGHDAFRLKNDKTIYIDPYKIKGKEVADIILITHEHFDHLSVDDINKISSENSVIVAARPCANQLGRVKAKEIKYVKPGDELEIDGVKIRAVPAYNITKFREPGRPFHPKDAGGVGYIVNMKGISIYHVGDSDFIPEMKELKVDVLLVPVSGTYVMTAEEAASVANAIMPKLAIPMHYGAIVGSERDAELFKKLAKCEVKILSKED